MKTCTLLSVLAFTLSAAPVSAQQLVVPVSRLRSPIDTVRANAFFEMANAAQKASGQKSKLVGPPIDLLVAEAQHRPDVASALISLLERENGVLASRRMKDDDYGEGYFLYVVEAVAGLRQKEAIKALMPSINTGDYVVSSIASLGNDAIPELRRSMMQDPQDDRVGAARAFGKIIANRSSLHIADTTVESMKILLLGALSDPKATVGLRSSAIAALTPLSGPDISAVMHSIADKDTARGFQTPSGNWTYPVRDAARKWLAVHKE
jgi:hypothetical protein